MSDDRENSKMQFLYLSNGRDCCACCYTPVFPLLPTIAVNLLHDFLFGSFCQRHNKEYSQKLQFHNFPMIIHITDFARFFTQHLESLKCVVCSSRSLDTLSKLSLRFFIVVQVRPSTPKKEYQNWT